MAGGAQEWAGEGRRLGGRTSGLGRGGSWGCGRVGLRVDFEDVEEFGLEFE